MKTISVTFNTLTPIYFGDASQDFTAIRPSAILGCMRFWLDVASVELGLEKYMEDLDKPIEDTNKEENSKPNINEIILKKLFENSKGSFYDAMILEEYKKTFKIKKWSDLLFGCENFKGNITIEEFKNIENNISKIEKNLIKIKYGEKAKCWFLPHKFYMGEFFVKFKVSEFLLKDYFYPLLHFINEVGYLGGKWNLGFGRVEVVKVINESLNREVNFKQFDKFVKCITIKRSRNYNIETHFKNIKQEKNDNQGKVVKFIIEEDNESNENKNKNEENTYKTYITGALKEKIKYRDIIREKTDEEEQRKEELKYLRHKVFGAAGKEDIQGSKVLPYVRKNVDGNFETGFLLLDGLYDLKGGGNKSE